MGKAENKNEDNVLKKVLRGGKKVLQGEIVSYKFFVKNWVYCFIFMAIFIVYISSRYKVQTQLQTIESLKKDLANAVTDKVRVSAFYNSNIREPKMRERADSAKLNLIMPDQPPYNLKKH